MLDNEIKENNPNSLTTAENSSKKQNENINKLDFYDKSENIKSKRKILSLNINNGRWTKDEHKKFIEAIFQHGNEWKKVQQHIKTRSSTQTRSHAQKFFIQIKKQLLEEEYSSLKKKDYSNDSQQYDKIYKLFKECIPSNEVALYNKDNLINFLLNINNFPKKERIKKNSKKNFEKAKLENNEIKRKSIFFIEKQSKNTNIENENVQDDVQYTDISHRKIECCNKDFLKLKRNLRNKKCKNKDKILDKKNNLFEVRENIFLNKLENDVPYSNNNENENCKFENFDYGKCFSPRNTKENFKEFNDVEIGYNNIFNEVDFLKIDQNEKYKYNNLNTFESGNFDNLFNYDENNDNYFN